MRNIQTTVSVHQVLVQSAMNGLPNLYRHTVGVGVNDGYVVPINVTTFAPSIGGNRRAVVLYEY